jgi:hypothetical protein
MSQPNFQTLFNDHFAEFVNAIQAVFPEDPDILTAKNGLIAIRKANPKLLIKIWNTYVIAPYGSQIEEGNIDFFLKKDYSADLVNAGNSTQIMESINRLRGPVQQMNETERKNVAKYLQNLSKLAAYHFASQN